MKKTVVFILTCMLILVSITACSPKTSVEGTWYSVADATMFNFRDGEITVAGTVVGQYEEEGNSVVVSLIDLEGSLQLYITKMDDIDVLADVEEGTGFVYFFKGFENAEAFADEREIQDSAAETQVPVYDGYYETSYEYSSTDEGELYDEFLDPSYDFLEDISQPEIIAECEWCYDDIYNNEDYYNCEICGMLFCAQHYDPYGPVRCWDCYYAGVETCATCGTYLTENVYSNCSVCNTALCDSCSSIYSYGSGGYCYDCRLDYYCMNCWEYHSPNTAWTTCAWDGDNICVDSALEQDGMLFCDLWCASLKQN